MRVILATTNRGKVAEICAALGDLLDLVPRPDDFPAVDEVGTTFLENARLKARSLAEATQLPALADDSGIEVDALQGGPGVQAAYFAGPSATHAQNVTKLIFELRDVEDPSARTARYRTVLVLHHPNGLEHIAEGTVEGVIAFSATGTGGFGYDPAFIPAEGDGRTFAEMSLEEKSDLSHRGRALRELRRQIESS